MVDNTTPANDWASLDAVLKTGKVRLTNDIEVYDNGYVGWLPSWNTSITTAESATIYLNNYVITNPFFNSGQDTLRVLNGKTLTLYSDAKGGITNDGNAALLRAMGDSTIVINGGNYIKKTARNGQTAIFTQENGKIIINNGYFDLGFYDD